MGKLVTRFVASRREYLYFLLKGPFVLLCVLLLIFELSQHTVRTAIHSLIADPDQTTEGIIVESRLQFGGKFQSTVRMIEYTYLVKGRVYQSSMIDYTQRGYNPAQYVNKYREGAKVLVFYDSTFPMLSILDYSNFNFGLIFSLGFALAIFVGSIAWRLWVSGPKFVSSFRCND